MSSIAIIGASTLFLTNTDRRGFLGRLAELPDRFRAAVRAFVLLDNHYHLLVRFQDASLSDAIRSQQVSLGSAFN